MDKGILVLKQRIHDGRNKDVKMYLHSPTGASSDFRWRYLGKIIMNKSRLAYSV